jgi:hypothetical protein
MNIKDDFSVQVLLQNKEDPFKDKHPPGWEHGIIIITKERVFKLFAKDYNFKELFLFMLNYGLK